jgi:O-antigen/teichoic acid export membrane protein
MPLGLITGPIVARALGPSGRGEVATATTYGNLAWIVLGVGVPWAVGQRVASGAGPAASALGTAARFCLALVPVSVAAALLLVLGPFDHLSVAASAGLVALVALAPLNVFANCQQSVLVASGALGSMSLLRAAPIVASAVAVIVLAVVGQLTTGTYLVVTVAAGLLVAGLTWKHLPILPRGRVAFRPLLSFGLRSFWGQAASYGNRFVDQAYLAATAPPRQLGLYAAAATVSAIPVSAGQAIAAKAFGEVARQHGDARWRAATRYMRIALFVGTASALALAVAAPVAVPLLFGRAFGGAVEPLIILLAGTATLSAGLTGVRILNAVNRPGAASWSELIALAVTLPGLALLVPMYGITGAAVVSTVAYWVRFVAMLVILRRAGLGSVRPRWADARDGVTLIIRSLRRSRSVSRRSVQP